MKCVSYIISQCDISNEDQLLDKVKCVVEMIGMYLHFKHPDKPFDFCLPDTVLAGPHNVEGQVLVRCFLYGEFICEFELESLLKYNSDTYGLACDLHTRCLDADSNFEYYLGKPLQAIPNQQNMLGVDLSDNADMTAIRKDGYTEWK